MPGSGEGLAGDEVTLLANRGEPGPKARSLCQRSGRKPPSQASFLTPPLATPGSRDPTEVFPKLPGSGCGTGLPLPVEPSCIPPPGASRHQGRAQSTLEFVVRLTLISLVSPYRRLYLPATIAAPYPWRLRVALFPTLPNFHYPLPTSPPAIRSAACAVAVAAVPRKHQLPSLTLVPAPVQPVSLRSS